MPECFGLGSDLKSDSRIVRNNFFDGKGTKTSYFGSKQLKLYNMELDPFEINDVSDANIEIVNFLLVKMADYYVSQNTV